MLSGVDSNETTVFIDLTREPGNLGPYVTSLKTMSHVCLQTQYANQMLYWCWPIVCKVKVQVRKLTPCGWFVSLIPTEPAAVVQRHLVNKCELHAAWTRVRPESADIAPRWGSAGRKVMTGVFYAQEIASPYSSPQTDYLN